VLAERGFAMEVTEVARRAHVGAGTVYRHFQSRQVLIGVVVNEVLGRTRSELTEIAATTEDSEAAIRKTMDVGFRRVRDYGQLTIELMAGMHPPVYPQVDVNRNDMKALFATLIVRGIKQGHFPVDLDVAYAVTAWFAVVSPEMSSSLLKERSVEEVACMTTEFFLAGLRGMPEGARERITGLHRKPAGTRS